MTATRILETLRGRIREDGIGAITKEELSDLEHAHDEAIDALNDLLRWSPSAPVRGAEYDIIRARARALLSLAGKS